VMSLLMLSACGPRYKLVDHFDAPLDPVAKQCVQSCNQETQSCSQECSKNHARCLDDARRKAQHAMPEQLDFYAVELDLYARDKRRYGLEMDELRETQQFLRRKIIHAEARCIDRKKDKGCLVAEALSDRLYHLSEPNKPSMPIKPSVRSLTDEYAAHCDSNCGCQQQFKRCYVSCGGKARTEKVCVSNC